MYEIDFIVNDKGHGVVVDTHRSAFNVYYMFVGIAAECFDDCLVQLCDLDTGMIIVECDSELWKGHYDQIPCDSHN